MEERALGVIETMGLVPAIEAADSGLKSAEVTLDGLEMAGAGLVSVLLRGDVSSVKAAVEAGSSAAGRLGRVISTTVIARTAEGLGSLLPGESGGGPRAERTESGVAASGERSGTRSAEQLNAMSVVELRAYARTIDDYPMTREEIRSARKADLIARIMARNSEPDQENA